MSTPKSNRIKKPSKPYPDFPLFPHATKRWAKKIRGKFCYFGPWDDPQGALERYLDQRDDLYAGRMPRESIDDGSTIGDLCNRFLNAKKHLLETGEITTHTFNDYHKTCKRVVRVFGKDRVLSDVRSDDFESLRRDMAKTLGPVSLGNEVTRVRVVFKYAYDAEIVDKPFRFGPLFKRPSKAVLRKERRKKGIRAFTASDIQTLLTDATVPMKAMILLGINSGMGNTDIALLPESAIDWKHAWLDYPRRKTNIERTAKLWPETIAALKAVKQSRPGDRTDETRGLLFVTKRGQSWSKGTNDNPITKEFRKLLDSCGIYRPGLSFYALRHTFETVAGESLDQVAVNHIMGHAPPSNDMSAVYRETISTERIVRTTDFVRVWLFGELKVASS